MVKNYKPNRKKYIYVDLLLVHVQILYQKVQVTTALNIWCTLQWVEVECSKLYTTDQTIQKINAKNGKETVNHANLEKDKTSRAFDISSSTNGIYSDPTLALLIVLYSRL